MPSPRRSLLARYIALSASALIMIFGVLAAACNDDGDPAPTSTPGTPSGSPEPTSTPTEAPADPDLGAELSYEGDFEGAIGVYAAIAAESEGEEQQEARLKQAQLLVRTGRYGEALAPLGAYLTAAGPGADASTARYMLASALDDTGDMQGALDSYSRYVNAGGALTPFARIEQAKLLARTGRAAEAQAAGDAVLASGDVLAPFYGSFTLSMGSAFDQAGATAEALAWYARVPDYGGDEATARARSGAIKQRLGDATWVNDYLFVVRGYPASGVAGDLLAELDAAAVPVGAFDRGLVYYRAFRNAEARAALDAAVAAGDRPAEATYYLAALDERAGDPESAIGRYAASYGLDPASPVADDALWWRGRLLEVSGRAQEASAVYAELATVFPSSQFAGDAGFHRGLVLYRSGDAAGAAFAWGAAASSAEDSERARALFWQARAEQDAGNNQYEQTFRAVLGEFPGDYYALRAEVHLGDNEDDEDDPDLDEDAPDWDKIEEYLRDAGYARETSPDPTADAAWTTAGELDAVGLHAQSDVAYRGLIEDNGSSVWGLYRLARSWHEDGRTSLAARAAAELLVELEDRDAPEPPDDLLRIAYPLAYNDLAQDAADEHDVPPLMLLALVRQESFYDPQAGSSAGALGLTQVIEPTGQAIADALGVPDFTIDDLYRPKLSLRFGASYLSDQLSAFDGNAYHALAAYNGGPGTAGNAIDSAGDDIEMFVEDLEFEETNLYVRLVMEHYARYRQVYEGLDRPSLPR